MKTNVLLKFVLALALLAVGQARGQTSSRPDSMGKPTVEDLLKFQNLTATLLAPDGKRVMFMIQEANLEDNRRYVNLWIADGMGGTRPLTSGKQIDENPRWSPDSQRLAFKSDRAAKPEGIARHQVWLIPASGGEAKQLTHAKFDIRTLEWSPDGKQIAVIATQPRPGQEYGPEVAGISNEEFCIYLISVPDGNATLVYTGDRPISSFSFSPKGNEIAFADQPNWREPEGHFHSVLKTVEIGSEQVRVLSGGELSSSGPVFSPDAKWIAFRGGPQKNWIANHYLYVVSASGGTVRPISHDFDEDIMHYEWAHDSNSVYFTGARGMDVDLFRATLTGNVVPVNTARGVTGFFSIAGEKMAFIHEAPNEPANVYLASLPGSSAARQRDKSGSAAVGSTFTPKAITDVDADVRKLLLGSVETIRWKNKGDGLEIEGQLLTPPNYQPGHAYPLLVVMHGGPNGQFGNGFILSTEVYPLQVFAAKGYVVFMPNPRGSTGYGEKFREMAMKDWGGADFRDIQDGVDELITRGIADKNRMGIMGWSYGGYLTAWTITHTNRFRAASVGAAPVDLFTMYGATDIPEFMETYFGGSPWKARELYFARSPMVFAERVKTPTLIQYGAEDSRVPTGVSEEFYRAIKESGVECEMLRYPDSGHGLGSVKLVRDAFERNLEWFNRFVKVNGAEAARMRK